MNISINFEDGSRLIVTPISETEKNNHFYYDYVLTLDKKDLFPNLDYNSYANSYLGEVGGDVIYSRDFISLYYIDKNKEMDNLNEILDVFNLSDKSTNEIYSYTKQEFIEETIEDIPELKKSDISNIKFLG